MRRAGHTDHTLQEGEAQRRSRFWGWNLHGDRRTQELQWSTTGPDFGNGTCVGTEGKKNCSGAQQVQILGMELVWGQKDRDLQWSTTFSIAVWGTSAKLCYTQQHKKWSKVVKKWRKSCSKSDKINTRVAEWWSCWCQGNGSQNLVLQATQHVPSSASMAVLSRIWEQLVFGWICLPKERVQR